MFEEQKMLIDKRKSSLVYSMKTPEETIQKVV